MNSVKDLSIVKSEPMLIVEFGTQWCKPCKTLEPVLAQIEKEYDVKVVRVDAEASPDLAQAYNIVAAPTMLLFHHGKVVEGMMGGQTKDAIVNKFKLLKRR